MRGGWKDGAVPKIVNKKPKIYNIK